MYRLEINSLDNRKISTIRVIDGDTIAADVHYKINDSIPIILINQRIRLARINAPERNTEDGKMIKNWLIDYLSDKQEISIISAKKDKYGRLLAEVYVDGQNLTDYIINSFPTIQMQPTINS